MSEGVKLDRVCADFGSFRAVNNVSIDIHPGEFFSFLGPSGCGKTTILRMISGFLEPSEGQIKIGGADMKGMPANKRPTALIFQNLALFPLMPVWENISFGLKVGGAPKKQRRARAEELLELVDLPGIADKTIAQLSGGQKQRIAIARALAVEPKVMLLDEPLSALDLKLRQHMRTELRAIQARTGVTFIYITHDQNEALAMSDRVAVMSKGNLQQVDTPENIYNKPANGFVAGFVGENTVIQGQASASQDGFVRFETPDGALLASSHPEKAGLSLYARPENIRVSRTHEDNSLPAKIEQLMFEGNVINFVARTPSGHTLMAQMMNAAAARGFAIGEDVNFVFTPQTSLLLPPSKTGGA